MSTTQVAACVASVLVLLTACSGGGQAESASINTDTDTAADTGKGQGEAKNFVEELGGSKTSFDDPVDYDDGLKITVSKPAVFVPSRNATTGAEENYVKFTVSVINGSDKKVAPADISVMVESQGGQGGDVVDAKQQMTGPPDRALKPGNTVTWVQGFGVLDPTDVAVLVQAGNDRVPVEFTK